ncbi:MAG: hypothetical protein NTX11_01155 [Candidatus Saccharibacteria bacterium]|nr:hypothetical protein [Candidatus Saccharibacteria bacterium]
MQEGQVPQPVVFQPGQAPQQTPPTSPVPQAPVPAPTPTPTPAPRSEPAQVEAQEDDDSIAWTASEFIAHSKTTGWYFMLIGITAVIAVAAFFLTDIVTTVMIVIVALLFGIMGSRKPRELPYRIDEQGVQVDKKMYNFASFKSFSIVQEEGIESIWFMPMQRFMPGLSIYFSPQEGQQIVDFLGEFLPYEEKQLDNIDRLMHRIRF